MSNEPVTIKISILGKEYQVNAHEEQRETLMRANEFLDARMAEAQKAHGAGSTESVAVMTALNLAHEVLRQNELLDEQAYRLRAIKTKIDGLQLEKN